MESSTLPTMTYGMIKPDAYSKQDEIFEIIKNNGFKIVQMRKMVCTPEKLALFYKEHEGKPFFPTLVKFMSSGPIVAMILSKENAIVEWRKLIGFNYSFFSFFFTVFQIGPTNSNVARQQAPDSIRARFGTDGSMNAVHGSANPADARREINFFFPNFVVDPIPSASETSSYISINVMPTLSEGLLELCKVKPENPVVLLTFLSFFFLFITCIRNGWVLGYLSITLINLLLH